MKRDMDLVRKILMTCVDHPHGRAPQELIIEGYTDEQIGYHVYLMMQAGLVKGVDVSGSDDPSPQAEVCFVTWDGHEFLEVSRDEGLWSRAKQAASAGGGMALDVLKAVLSGLVTAAAKRVAGLA